MRMRRQLGTCARARERVHAVALRSLRPCHVLFCVNMRRVCGLHPLDCVGYPSTGSLDACVCAYGNTWLRKRTCAQIALHACACVRARRILRVSVRNNNF
eukprot:5777746-Pleurochrysis_carterae.AAC.3